MMQPVDGWRVIAGENGEEVHFRRTVNLSCHAGPQYYHPVSHHRHGRGGCRRNGHSSRTAAEERDKPNIMAWLDEEAKLGFVSRFTNSPLVHPDMNGAAAWDGILSERSNTFSDKCENFGHESFRDILFRSDCQWVNFSYLRHKVESV